MKLLFTTLYCNNVDIQIIMNVINAMIIPPVMEVAALIRNILISP
ncbi:hypothetical protein [Clostridium grantii]|nr:hypothetical protein [Clostridium grantii]